MTKTYSLEISTRGFCDIHDITSRVEQCLHDSGTRDGIAVVFVPGATAAITALECESGAIEDFKDAIERLAPEGAHYKHDAAYGDGNGFSHVRAALLGPSASIPVSRGRLGLGTWQRIVLADFDNRPRSRSVVVQIMG